jgi:3-phosphoshikimate 1-carboxyvinyltransferase
MLEIFGINIGFENMVFSVPGGQVYRSPGKLQVEGDWSNAAFWLAAGAVAGNGITYTGLDVQSRQGDRAMLDILTQFGALITQTETAVTVSGGKLRGIMIDARDIPDLVPILAVVATAADGVTKIRNAGRLRDKESDRLAAVTDVLRGLGANIDERKDGLTIHGGTALTGGQVSSWGDHRIAMAAAIAATICAEPVVIRGAEAVNKSYPGFFDDLRSLGGTAIAI